MFGAHPMLRTGGAVSYSVPYSLRFRAANSAYLSRTPSAADATRTKASISIWLKRGALGGRYSIYSINPAGSAGASNQITMIFDNAGSNGDNLTYNNGSVNRTSTSLYRDPSAWYNFCQIFDTTQATAADRVKTYINGVLLTDINIGQDFTLNSNTPFGQSGITEYIGRRDSGLYYDGYMAEVVFVVGQALTPSSFGQTDATTGVWVPKKYSGTYGTNGFYLKFADASAATATAIGKDSSGNGNNWTPSGISVTSGVTFDQMLDTPTLNYAVMNPLDLSGTAATFQWANTQVTRSGASFAQAYCSIQMSSGKWYCEMTAGADVANLSLGLITGTANAAANRYLGQDSFTYGYDPDGRKVNNASYSLYGNSWTAGDIIGIILDADNGKLYFSKNGTVQNSGDPVAGTNAAFTGLTGPYRFAAAFENGGIGDFNFGQRAFSYTPPTGFKALNSANLPTPSIKKGSLYMDATLRTGTGATASVSSLGFQPDLVWIKSRSAATNHNLFDSTRGVQKGLGSNLQSGQYTDANSLTAFNATGYSLGSDASARGVNINTNTYVDWAWKEGATPGFDVVTFAGTGAAQAVNHGLGVAPEFMILRVYDDTLSRTWACWHKNLTSAAYYLPLEGIAAEAVDTTMFNSTAPTSTQFTAGSYNSVSTKNSVAYLWASVAGFSMIGSWTGNASTDGPFVWCGFRPRFLLLRNKSVASYWIMLDSVRNTANVVTDELIANTANAENGLAITSDIDFLASGFKIRSADANLNQSGNTIIFAAFAENPFKYARAR